MNNLNEVIRTINSRMTITKNMIEELSSPITVEKLGEVNRNFDRLQMSKRKLNEVTKEVLYTANLDKETNDEMRILLDDAKSEIDDLAVSISGIISLYTTSLSQSKDNTKFDTSIIRLSYSNIKLLSYLVSKLNTKADYAYTAKETKTKETIDKCAEELIENYINFDILPESVTLFNVKDRAVRMLQESLYTRERDLETLLEQYKNKISMKPVMEAN